MNLLASVACSFYLYLVINIYLLFSASVYFFICLESHCLSKLNHDLIFQAEITVAKFPNRAHVYAVEGDFPMIFDIDGRGTEIYPTGINYFCIRYPISIDHIPAIFNACTFS